MGSKNEEILQRGSGKSFCDHAFGFARDEPMIALLLGFVGVVGVSNSIEAIYSGKEEPKIERKNAIGNPELIEEYVEVGRNKFYRVVDGVPLEREGLEGSESSASYSGK